MSAKQWPSDWMRAALGLCVLRTLAAGPTYGYAIAAALEENGFGQVKGGTLYPLLTRFEAAGWIAVDWRVGAGGPERKYLSLTDAGRRELEAQTAAWRDFTGTVFAHLDSADLPSTAAPKGTDAS
ncbi:PadR family transcriptional regulator [Cryobacterium frigoriphilum]|uniref:PadR family transcriptional regulator n=1 Tax=Cryobacterium frigoriphilum TaxID=1259150 RepID=A0A4R9A0A2_9MICO|nr:helix-turn-helix transcriptional regulator [Cryobacterium frigoriphilum]TFD49872.1 PadR family transcriptional regulator [Cryobacterium frigoriphilum]